MTKEVACDDKGVLTLAITYVGAKDLYTLPGEDYRLNDPSDRSRPPYASNCARASLIKYQGRF